MMDQLARALGGHQHNPGDFLADAGGDHVERIYDEDKGRFFTPAELVVKKLNLAYDAAGNSLDTIHGVATQDPRFNPMSGTEAMMAVVDNLRTVVNTVEVTSDAVLAELHGDWGSHIRTTRRLLTEIAGQVAELLSDLEVRYDRRIAEMQANNRMKEAASNEAKASR